MSHPKIQIIINAENPQELLSQIQGFLSATPAPSTYPAHSSHSAYPVTSPEDASEESAAPAPARRGRKPKAETQASTPMAPRDQGPGTIPMPGEHTPEKIMPAPPPKPEMPNDPPPTKDKAAQALARVLQQEGLGYDKAREILAKFNAQSLAGVDPAKYREFINECDMCFTTKGNQS